MKIITFWGGLGNTILEYAYYLWLREQFPNENFYSYYPSAGLKGHNGFELDEHFDVNLPPTSAVSNAIGFSLFSLMKITKRLHLPCPFTSTMRQRNDKALFHCDFFQHKDMMPRIWPFGFKPQKLSKENEALMHILENENSVAVHIRRGDYLNPRYASNFSGICTEKYYEKALDWVKENVDNPHYVFFSDDTYYVRQNFKLDNMTIVDWNTGNQSYMDMYLMSHCKYMILANSTFSYCAARLNKDVKQVLCPVRWTNSSNKKKLALDSWQIVQPK